MKLVLISDTHNECKGLVLPDGDVLIHSGDHTGTGKRAQLERAAKWLGGYKNQFRHILTIAGNHDFICQKSHRIATETFMRRGITYLQDARYKIDGVLFYGSPWQPWYHDWAFNFPPFPPDGDGDRYARRIWGMIPEETDVLITHGPPKGIFDKTQGGWGTREGCPYLRGRIEGLKNLKVHAFGHIHEANGIFEKDGTTFANSAICNREQYAPIQPYHVVEI